MNQEITSLGFGLVSASVIAMAAVGFTLQFGISRIFNVSYGAMMTAAAYVAYVVDIDLHTSIWVGMLAGGLAGAVLGVASERLVFSPFSRRGATVFTVVMVSLGLDVLVQNGLIAIAGSSFFTYRLPPEHVYHVLGMVLTPTELILIAIAVVSMLAIHFLLRVTQLGKAMRAASADRELASGCGINVALMTTITWALSGALAGLGGVALAINTAAFSPVSGDQFVFIVFAAAVVGGLGQPYGAMLGALAIGIVTEEFAIINAPLKYVGAFVVLIAILVLRPGGLVQIGGRARRDAVAA
jgi:branched-subunit amino acid ABC-type transport system permease component